MTKFQKWYLENTKETEASKDEKEFHKAFTSKIADVLNVTSKPCNLDALKEFNKNFW